MKKEQAYEYENRIFEDAEISANKLNLIFLLTMIALSGIIIALSVFGIFSVALSLIIPVCSASAALFSVPLFIYLINDRILKRKPSVLKWDRLKYVIYVFAFFGLFLFDLMLSFHAVLLLVVPMLIAAQYSFNKRDWIIIIVTTIITVPLVIYGGFIIGVPDRNLIKDLLTEEQSLQVSQRLAVLPQRAFSIFLHYVLPRILEIAAIYVLMAAIVKRNKNMLDKQVALAKAVAEQTEKTDLIQETVIEELASVIETRDVGTGEHVRRTKQYVKILCEKLSQTEKYKDVLTPEVIENVVAAAPLHDIGKIVVSDLILLKPDKLTKEEFDKMKVHSEKGGEMIREFFARFEDDDFVNAAYDIAMHHHEKWDGSGYPSGLKGDRIPLSARIMAISDVFDALVSKRVYKDAIGFEQAFDILVEESGKHFDPELIEALKAVKGEFFAVASNER